MATLTLDRLWLNRVGDGASVAAFSRDRTRTYAVKGEVRVYGSGRMRAVTTAGVQDTFKFTITMVSLATISTLNSWCGVAVQIRDHRGQKYVGTFFQVDVSSEIKDNINQYEVQISLIGVTVPEGV